MKIASGGDAAYASRVRDSRLKVYEPRRRRRRATMALGDVGSAKTRPALRPRLERIFARIRRFIPRSRSRAYAPLISVRPFYTLYRSCFCLALEKLPRSLLAVILLSFSLSRYQARDKMAGRRLRRSRVNSQRLTKSQSFVTLRPAGGERYFQRAYFRSTPRERGNVYARITCVYMYPS